MIKRLNAKKLPTNFGKQDILRILFSDEKFFDINGVYNSESERVCVGNKCADADESEMMLCRNESSPRESNSVVGCLLFHAFHTLDDLE